jgi:hypothetical protein
MSLEPEDVTTIVDAIKTNAQRLGLTWMIRPGVVMVTSSRPGEVAVKLDADEATIDVISIIGNLDVETRVWVLVIPDVGSYIIGWCDLPRTLMMGESRTETISFASATSYTQAISFDRTYGTAPDVVAVISSGAGETAQWNARAINVNTTGFTMFLYRNVGMTANAWTGWPVTWIASGI